MTNQSDAGKMTRKMQLLLAANTLWYGAGFLQFFFRARTSFLHGIRRQAGAPSPTHADHAADIFRYLGAMNGALCASNIMAWIKQSDAEGSVDLFWIWGAGHLSQMLTTIFVVAPSQRWYWEGRGLGMITYIDTLLGILNCAYAASMDTQLLQG